MLTCALAWPKSGNQLPAKESTQSRPIWSPNLGVFAVSAGEHQNIERPFGHADPAGMFAWAGATASWPIRTDPGGSRGLDDYFTRDYARRGRSSACAGAGERNVLQPDLAACECPAALIGDGDKP